MHLLAIHVACHKFLVHLFQDTDVSCAWTGIFCAAGICNHNHPGSAGGDLVDLPSLMETESTAAAVQSLKNTLQSLQDIGHMRRVHVHMLKSCTCC